MKKLPVETTRKYLKAVNKRLIKEARRKGELDRGVTVAIDRTKGPVNWHGEVERDEDGNITEPWILGYKDKRLYFQWATIQVVGNDVPIVLDAIPVKRKMKRADIVDELLSSAKEMVNIREVQADREYDVKGVRRVVEKHGLIYRTAGKVTGLRGTCTKLRNKGAWTYIIEEGGLNGAKTQKTVFVPALNSEVYDPEDQQVDEDDESDDEDADESTEDPEIRQQMMDEFGDITDTDEEETRRMFGDIIDEMKEEEEKRPESEIYGSDADVEAYAIFKTNDPRASLNDCEDKWDVIEVAHRAARPYRARWAIEEGNKKLKQFMAKTKSPDHEFRYFNMAFGALLYNVWRLVDLLVQLSLEMEYDYSPHVTADEFLTCAEEHFDLDTPPPPVVAGAV